MLPLAADGTQRQVLIQGGASAAGPSMEIESVLWSPMGDRVA